VASWEVEGVDLLCHDWNVRGLAFQMRVQRYMYLARKKEYRGTSLIRKRTPLQSRTLP